MASRNVKLKIETQLQKKALDDAVKGIRNVDKAMEKSGKTSVKMANEGVKANKRNSHAAGQAALQLQDVAVQAQMGTDSMRILGQQGPQLLSAFGPKGMLAGLAVAVGAGLVSAFRKPKEEIGKLIEEIERLESIGISLEDLNVQRLEDSISAATQRANEAREAFQRMMDSRAQSERVALDATESLIAAEIKLIELRGGSTSELKSELALKKEERRLQEQAEKAANDRVKTFEQLKIRQQEFRDEVEKVNAQIKARTFELEKQKSIQVKLNEEQQKADEAVGGGFVAAFGVKPSNAKQQAAQDAFLAAREGDLTIDSLKQELETLRNSQETLRLNIRNTAEEIEESASTLSEDLKQIDFDRQGAAIIAAADNTKAQFTALENTLIEAADAFGAQAPSGIAAKIRELLEDGIQTGDLADLLMATKQLTNRVNQSFGEQQKTMREVIGQLQILSNKSAEFDSALGALKAQNKAVRASR